MAARAAIEERSRGSVRPATCSTKTHNHFLAGEGQPCYVPPVTAVNAHARVFALRTRPGRRAGGGIDYQGSFNHRQLPHSELQPREEQLFEHFSLHRQGIPRLNDPVCSACASGGYESGTEAKQAAATSSATLSEDTSRQNSPGYMVTR